MVDCCCYNKGRFVGKDVDQSRFAPTSSGFAPPFACSLTSEPSRLRRGASKRSFLQSVLDIRSPEPILRSISGASGVRVAIAYLL